MRASGCYLCFQNNYTRSLSIWLKEMGFHNFSHFSWQFHMARIFLFLQSYLSDSVFQCLLQFLSGGFFFLWGSSRNRTVTSQSLQASICSQAITARHMHSLSHHLLRCLPSHAHSLPPIMPMHPAYVLRRLRRQGGSERKEAQLLRWMKHANDQWLLRWQLATLLLQTVDNSSFIHSQKCCLWLMPSMLSPKLW